MGGRAASRSIIMIIGHERQMKYLDTIIERGRLAHAYLFYGPEHVGKLTVAKWLAKKLHCDKGGCEVCYDCRMIGSDSHPYVTLLDTEHTLLSKKVPRLEGRDGGTMGLAKERKEIPIDDIRELKRLFALTPAGGGWRAVIINEAEKMSTEAANAFLKLLEEPGSRALFILITEDRESVLPTIASRALPMRFSPLPDNAIRAFLETKVKDALLREDIVKFAAGRPGVAVGLAENKEAFLRERRLAAAVGAVCRGGTLAALRLSERIAEDRVRRGKAVEYLIRALRRDLREESSEKRGISVEKLKKVNYIAALLDTTNVNPRLALDAMFFAAGQK